MKMETVLIPKPRQLGYCETIPKDPYICRAYILDKPILGELEEKTKHFHNMQKPAHEREILTTMSEKEIAEVFSARLIKFLKDHFENNKQIK